MTVTELIDILSRVENKNKLVGYWVNGDFKTLDNMIGVGEYADCVVLQHDITDLINEAKKGLGRGVKGER